MADSNISDSILLSVRKMIGGLDTDGESPFDVDLIIHINSAFTTLAQLGVGPEEQFRITDESDSWSDFDYQDIDAVKTYIYLKVKTIFDPPANSFVLNEYKNQIAELEWRMNVIAEGKSNENNG